jgi:hypothetical protein
MPAHRIWSFFILGKLGSVTERFPPIIKAF